jgi:DnaD/phage-associated family protein
MDRFKGFPQGKVRLTPLPEAFFRQLLPQIDHLGELKVVLHAVWLLDNKEGAIRFLRQADFGADQAFMDGLGQNAQAALEDALQRAVNRGVLLSAVVSVGQGEEKLYFLNSPRGRAAVEAIARGEWHYSGDMQQPLHILDELPNVFRLYEENIGPLTPLIADTLRQAEQEYPLSWIEEAVRLAVANNARSWRYIEAILERWQAEGKDEQKDRRDTEKARRKYAEWENLGSG